MQAHPRQALSGVTREAARYLVRNAGTFSPYFFAAAFFYFLIDAVGLELSRANGILSNAAYGSDSPGVFFANSLFIAVVSAAIAVPVHNQILNGPFQRRFPAANVVAYWFVESICYFLIFTGLLLITNMTTDTTIQIDGDGVQHVTRDAWWKSFSQLALIAISFLTSFVLSIRMVTLLPHVAITKFHEIRWRWAFGLSKRHFWSIFLRFLGVGMLTSLPGFVFAFFLGDAISEDSLSMRQEYALSFLYAITASVTLLLCVALASFSFLRLSQTVD